MHDTVGTNLGPMQRSSQKKDVSSFPSHFSFLLGLLKSLEEKVFTISGTDEASGPWRVDLVVEYYKIHLRKKNSPGLSAAA